MTAVTGRSDVVAAQPKPVTGQPETLVDVLTRRAESDPAAVVATFLGAGGVTAGELLRGAERVARQLASPALGLGPQMPVVTCLRPGPALAVVVAGVARAGLVEVPVALDTPGGGPRAAVALLGTAALAANPALATLAPAVFTVDDGGGPGTLDDVRPGPLPHPPGPGDPALVLSTSGTTGRPKGVLLPHFAGVRHARRVSDSMRYGPDDVLYNAFPWNHVNVRHTGLLAALVSGARLLAVPRFSASAFWAVCRAEGVTAFNFMGAVAAILLRTGKEAGEHGVTRAYGGPAPRWLAEQFRSRFGVELVEAYACTELGDVTSNRVGDVVMGTAGKPLPEYEVTLRDGAGKPVPQGEIGGITVRARHPHISTLGYVGGPGGPPEWIATGDLGRFDDGGRLVFCGRHSDVIRRRGENISAWDVESAVAAMPGVREAAAAGVSSEFTEEDLLVAVGAGADVTPGDVHAWCRERLPRHAWPRYVAVLDSLPRNGSGKVSKPALRDPALVAAAADLEHLRRSPAAPPAIPAAAGSPPPPPFPSAGKDR
ncbi:ATP-dependent acyl-CoA ligase [Paractinoplanes abujensis]|uniref:Crotonobetaine/carnitine-CoA ligase n=1 Tax=Paractinoplanes abujensis TaxID=882441 RepID=A0A7W7CSK1_9ACTN|nr:AMP-binding protein [Actinoplanes abujensis]MBB4693913.1 crotonobetaine/carnitine-CoA ligase [Actinoplanes abujensis]GID21431.1 ATP-dependent acyl-CoA ligase [Actinoplanes abujensis]